MNQNLSKITFVICYMFVFAQAWTIKCYCNSTYYDEASYQDAGRLVQGPCFSAYLTTYFYAFGLNGSEKTQLTDKVIEAVLQVGNINICLIDWMKEAMLYNVTNTPLGFSRYFVIAKNAATVGNEAGTAVVNMLNAGMDRNTTLVIGHSLGGHLVGSLGDQVKTQTQMPLPRIIACDAAKPGYEDPLPVYPRLSKDSAECVDVLHTDYMHFGINARIGDRDTFVNPDEYDKNGVQPACPKSTLLHPIEPFSSQDFCSHRRSVELLVELILHPHSFPAAKAPDAKTWAAYNGSQTDFIYWGEEYKICSGLYFFSTNSQSPYSRGQDGLKPRTAS